MRYWLGSYVLQDIGFGPAWVFPVGAVSGIDLRSIPQMLNLAIPTGVGIFETPNTVNLGADYERFGQGDIRTEVPNEQRRGVFASMLGLASVTGTTLAEWIWDVLTLRADPAGLTHCKPLLPSIRFDTGSPTLLKYTFGSGSVRNVPFDLTMPEAANAIEVMRNDYRQIRQDALDGKMGTTVNREFIADPQFHRKLLDSWAEKFRINNPEDVFISNDLPRETRLPHSTTIVDDFIRADGDTIGDQLTWTEVDGDWDTVSNQAELQTASGDVRTARAESDLSTTDHYAQSRAKANPSDLLTEHGAAARFSSSSEICYVAFAYGQDDNIYTFKLNGASQTLIAQTLITPVTNDIYKVQANGSIITAYQNGTQRLSSTDTTITTGTRCGIMGFNGGTTKPLIDDFEAADLAAAAATRMDDGWLRAIRRRMH